MAALFRGFVIENNLNPAQEKLIYNARVFLCAVLCATPCRAARVPWISLFHKQLSTDFTCNTTRLKRTLVCACVI